MKKWIALLVVAAVVISLCAACGNSSSESSTAGKNEESSAAANDTESVSEEAGESSADASEAEPSQAEETEAEPAAMESGDTGDGPADLDAGLVKFTLPEGYSYEVDSIYIDEDDPLAGNLFIYLTKTDASIALPIVKVNASTMDMVSSQEEAVQKTIELCNLQTYSDGKYAIGDDVTYGANTYTRVDVTTEYSDETFYVTYANTGNSYGTGLKVCVQVNNKEIEADDPLINAVLESIQIVKK